MLPHFDDFVTARAFNYIKSDLESLRQLKGFLPFRASFKGSIKNYGFAGFYFFLRPFISSLVGAAGDLIRVDSLTEVFQMPFGGCNVEHFLADNIGTDHSGAQAGGQMTGLVAFAGTHQTGG